MPAEPKGPEIEKAIDLLFQSPLEEFTSRRDQLARELRERGDKEGGVRVKALKKPSAAAWALNQIARSQPKQIGWLIEADESLRKARGRDEIREASAARNQTIGFLLAEAMSAIKKAGYSATAGVREKISETLHAVATDDEARELLRQGRLVREFAPGGFGPADVAARQVPEGQAADRRARERSDKLRGEAALLIQKGKRLRSEAGRLERESRRMKDQADRAASQAAKVEEQAHRKLKQSDELSGQLK